MSQVLLIKALAALEARNLELTESTNRIFLLLPRSGRVNVMVRTKDGDTNVATLTLNQKGEITVRLSEEPPDNVRRIRE